MNLDRKLRMGMVGGGRGAFIGAVHRMAANLDGKIELVAGAFSSDPEKSKASGRDLFLEPSRIYTSYQEMAAREAALPADRRIDFVSIVTPNNMHVPIARTFLDAGFNVVCDKPLAISLTEALDLREIVRKSGRVFALTHNYTGYPMVKQAREMVREGKLGTLLKVVSEYPQGWHLAVSQSGEGAIGGWRADPKVSGAANAIGDIGTHAENLCRYTTGLRIDELCAELTSFIPGHQLDDDGNLLVRFKGGAKGIIYASQVSSGDENNLNIRIYGTQGSLHWYQEHPNELTFKAADKPPVVYRRGNSYLTKAAQNASRIPFGHPEAFIEAFANVYLRAAEAIADQVAGRKLRDDYDFPNIDDGVYGMAFIETVVKSAKSDSKWTKFPEV